MTTTAVPGVFTLKKKADYFFGDLNDRKIELPGRPYIAVRLRRIEE